MLQQKKKQCQTPLKCEIIYKLISTPSIILRKAVPHAEATPFSTIMNLTSRPLAASLSPLSTISTIALNSCRCGCESDGTEFRNFAQ